MTQLSTVCGAFIINNQIVFFNVNVRHSNEITLRYMDYQNIQTFYLKVCNSGNEQTNDNGLNGKLKSHYNDTRASWMMKYRIKNFYLTKLNQYWWKNGTTLYFIQEKSSGTS